MRYALILAAVRALKVYEDTRKAIAAEIVAAVEAQRQKDAAIARNTRSVDGWQDFYDRAAELIADAIEAQE